MNEKNQQKRQELEARVAEVQEAGNALAALLRSPQGALVPDYLSLVLKVEPLMRDTPEKTAHALGQFDVIRLMQDIQRRANHAR